MQLSPASGQFRADELVEQTKHKEAQPSNQIDVRMSGYLTAIFAYGHVRAKTHDALENSGD